MENPKTLKIFYFLTIILLGSSVFGQNTKRDKMEQLSFMTGEWVGTSRGYENGVVTREEPAYENIKYDLDRSILVIELNTESLQLHTIIYYDEKDETYYYYPFSKNGVTRATAEFKDRQLMVWRNEKTRYIFRQTSEGGFQEYGEKLIEGKWIKYFEDTFKNTK
jgi:hypothetical protein